MRFENLISFESSVTPLGLAVGIAGVAALAYYLGRRDGVTRATSQQLADELERRAAVDPAILKPVVDLFLARQREISGWRPTFMSGTRPGTGIYQYLFKPSMNGVAAYVFCRKENKSYVLLNV